MSYKVSNTSNGASGKEKIIEECQVDKEIDSLLANTTTNALKSDATMPLNTVEKISQVEKSEIILKGKQVPARKISGPVVGPSDGWGSAFKSSGIGAKIKKPAKGLSMAKPLTINKIPSSNSLVDIAESIDREKRDVGLAITRSFDDLKQIGRLQRDLMAQQLEEVPSKRISSNSNLSMSIEDFPSLDVIPPPPPPPQKATNGKNSSSYGSSSRDSTIPVPPTLPPGLSIEQRNESIKAFVEEVRRKKELDQASSSSSEKDCKSSTSSTDTKTTKKNSNGWAKTGGVTEKVDAISNKSISSISNVDYPSLSQMKSTQSTSNTDILKWGEKPPPPPPKSASDLLLAKKKKAANKIKNPRIS
jgi:hypothetical protein